MEFLFPCHNIFLIIAILILPVSGHSDDGKNFSFQLPSGMNVQMPGDFEQRLKDLKQKGDIKQDRQQKGMCPEVIDVINTLAEKRGPGGVADLPGPLETFDNVTTNGIVWDSRVINAANENIYKRQLCWQPMAVAGYYFNMQNGWMFMNANTLPSDAITNLKSAQKTFDVHNIQTGQIDCNYEIKAKDTVNPLNPDKVIKVHLQRIEGAH